MKQGKIIVISGGPRTGKSSLVKLLADKLQGQAFLEGEEKDFPVRILEDIKSQTNLMEVLLWFRNKSIKEYIQALKLKREGVTSILDCFWLTNNVYVEEWISDEFEKSILMELGSLDLSIFDWPDLILSLSADKETIKQFSSEGAREFEQNEEYLQKQVALNNAHEAYFRNIGRKNILFINRSGLDYSEESTLNDLVDKVRKLL